MAVLISRVSVEKCWEGRHVKLAPLKSLRCASPGRRAHLSPGDLEVRNQVMRWHAQAAFRTPRQPTRCRGYSARRGQEARFAKDLLGAGV